MSPPPGSIAAVVVTYQSASTIDECLRRLRAAQGVAAIRVVDNASGDDTLRLVQRHATADARVRFIANPDNPGFGTACNQGVAEVAPDAAEWVALVNPDLMVEGDSLARVAALAGTSMDSRVRGNDREDSRVRWNDDVPPSRHPRERGDPWTLLGADLVGEDGVRDPAARRRDPDFAAMLRTLLSGGSTAAAMAIPPDDRLALQPVEAVSGALMLLPRALYDHLGGFDEAYRLHAEDLDLCRRARQAGAAIAVANQVRVLHVRGVSSRSNPVFVEWHKHHGLWRYFSRFEAPRRGLATRVAVWLAVWARFALAMLRHIARP
ncbi:glycosyltransferase family 2 protein [Lysobacter sp. GX 14042]|uniref:glycosyltransferase family 2 protein n=1 Tax=Lysobacter sp. GX 14042 TaxID=2907155 RepID=UPI001F2173B9|nr:glycosyltransferase family 2 protein [Lysobacter sp. GX 14042]MCE7032747.1 glycosyltransferase family 2 protein [Lysobacter sp. GX 14042]